MHNAELPADHPMAGTFVLSAIPGRAEVTYLTEWPDGRWWTAPLLFWDDFTEDGALGPQCEGGKSVGSLCLGRTIPAGTEANYTYLLAWHFPNRTPAWCGWRAAKGEEHTIIGNYYCTRFGDAWEAAAYAAGRLEILENRTRAFTQTVRDSTIPDVVKEAAMANLSTLATPTCFRTADGEFRGFEGIDDQSGCCFGNCVHVWNYETTTAHLFPGLSRSMRRTAFLNSSDERGHMDFRQILPAGKEPFGIAAADGQMGQIMKAYLDWLLCGDDAWLREMWPRIKRAIEFAWAPGGWDADRDGVMEGVQHNTYDVEFFGPNPQCGAWYLGALRAAEEMAGALGERENAREYRRLFESGSRWIDANLFNGEYYVQQVRPASNIAKGLFSARGADDPEEPDDFQVGEGCLVDQLVGQYFAHVCGLGELLKPENTRAALRSILKYNHKRDLTAHDAVQRIFALNDERALVICDYAGKTRPRTPFPYYAEVMTGFEYSAAILMLYAGLIEEGIECIENIRLRYDGERRNPWDEAECGRHYARAMAAWSAIVALSGFHYHGRKKVLTFTPRSTAIRFSSIWSSATGWGSFSQFRNRDSVRLAISVTEGELGLRELRFTAAGYSHSRVSLSGRSQSHMIDFRDRICRLVFPSDLRLRPGEGLRVALSGASA
jgi:uncharacterized protein (DUF608 family)